MKKMIISALIASMIAMSALTGCGSSSAKPQEEAKEAVQEEQMKEQTEDVRDAEIPEFLELRSWSFPAYLRRMLRQQRITSA